MPFDKNPDTINRNGRTPGKGNRTTDELRQTVKQLIDANMPRLQSDLNELEPMQRLQVLTGLLKFVLPQLKATEITDRSAERVQPIKISFYEGD